MKRRSWVPFVAGMVVIGVGLAVVWRMQPGAVIRGERAAAGTNAPSTPNATQPTPPPVLQPSATPQARPEIVIPTNLPPDELLLYLSNAGNELVHASRFEDAIRLYEKALELRADDEETHFSLAFCYNRLGNTNEAITHYEEALKIFPDFGEAHNNLGNLLVAQDRLDEAIVHFKSALEVNPDHASAHNNLGTVLVRQKKIKEAAEAFAEAVRLRPEYTEARFNLATASLALNDTNTAQIQFDQLLMLSTNKSETQTVIGAVLARGGKYREAEQHLKEALDYNPGNVDALFNLASVYHRVGMTNKAIEGYRSVIRLRPGFGPAETALAVLEGRLAWPPALQSSNVIPSTP